MDWLFNVPFQPASGNLNKLRAPAKLVGALVRLDHRISAPHGSKDGGHGDFAPRSYRLAPVAFGEGAVVFVEYEVSLLSDQGYMIEFPLDECLQSLRRTVSLFQEDCASWRPKWQ